MLDCLYFPLTGDAYSGVPSAWAQVNCSRPNKNCTNTLMPIETTRSTVNMYMLFGAAFRQQVFKAKAFNFKLLKKGAN